jgi:hypothetical protein
MSLESGVAPVRGYLHACVTIRVIHICISLTLTVLVRPLGNRSSDSAPKMPAPLYQPPLSPFTSWWLKHELDELERTS